MALGPILVVAGLGAVRLVRAGLPERFGADCAEREGESEGLFHGLLPGDIEEPLGKHHGLFAGQGDARQVTTIVDD